MCPRAPQQVNLDLTSLGSKDFELRKIKNDLMVVNINHPSFVPLLIIFYSVFLFSSNLNFLSMK